MSNQPSGPLDQVNAPGEPNPLKRARAFMEQRLVTGGGEDGATFPPESMGDLATRSDRVAQYRQQHVTVNPAFPVNNGIVDPKEPPSQAISTGDLVTGGAVDLLLPGSFYPIGPSVLLDGEVGVNQPITPPLSGRMTSLAVQGNGNRVYAGSANGGIWRSDDLGENWRPLMNAVHMAPMTTQSDSLAIGAVIMDPNNLDRIFAGTGEGPGSVQIGGGPEFFGIGPVMSQDGGASWQVERVNDDALNGSAFFKMILDPDDSEKVTAATRHGVLQRRPRNHQIQGAFKPQAYFFTYRIDSLSLNNYYWNQNGTGFSRDWSGGSGFLPENPLITPFSFKGRPYFVVYDPSNGEIGLNYWDGDGSPVVLTGDGGAVDWGRGWTDFLPVVLMGRAHMLSYNSGNGQATLWFLNINDTGLTFAVQKVWENRNWGRDWTNFIPMTIQGQPYFIAYDLLSGTTTLQQWLPNGEHTRVWVDDFSSAVRMMAFNVGANSYLLVVFSQDGSGSLLRFNSDGSFDDVSEMNPGTFENSINLQLVPFESAGQQRFLAYDYNQGVRAIFRWDNNMVLRSVDEFLWDRGLIIKGFTMGYEWYTPEFDPKPVSSPRLSDPNTPTASGLAVAKNGNATHYFAAFWDGKVYRSTDGGANWRVLGKKFPELAGRVTIACQLDNPKVVYAFLQHGLVYRWSITDDWIEVTGVPNEKTLLDGQGSYDLSLAVSPNDVNTIYIGGATHNASAALYRCKVVDDSGIIFTGYKMEPTWIGHTVHADVHALLFRGNRANELWVGCDGGVFATTDALNANANAIRQMFKPKNCGLGTQTVNALAQHPVEDAVLYCGTQDNGGQIYTGYEAWRATTGGDGGHVLVDWSTPSDVLFSVFESEYYVSTRGGERYIRGQTKAVPNVDKKDALFYPPYAGTPVQAGANLVSQRIAFGSNRPWLHNGFGKVAQNWVSMMQAPLGTTDGFRISAMAFTAPNRLFVGLMNGRVYRLDENNPGNVPWALTRLDNVNNNPLVVTGPITAITPDPADATNSSIFITVGGTIGDFRRVWLFDGTDWAARSGVQGGTSALLDVQYNTIAGAVIAGVTHLFAGADIGIWHSPDGGLNWRPFSTGLPETGVFDLKVFPANAINNRPWLLRAATYGRSVYERVIAGGTNHLQASLTQPVQLYLRTNDLDRGLYPASTRNAAGLLNLSTDIRMSVDIKMLKKAANNAFNEPEIVNFCKFCEIVDQSFSLVVPVEGRIYVQIHNRGLATANGVKVRLLITQVNNDVQAINNANAMPQLPANMPSLVKNNTPIDINSGWRDLGTKNVDNLFAGTPLVSANTFPLVTTGSYFVLAVLDHPKDPFTDRERNAMNLITNNRKAALSYFVVA